MYIPLRYVSYILQNSNILMNLIILSYFEMFAKSVTNIQLHIFLNKIMRTKSRNQSRPVFVSISLFFTNNNYVTDIEV